VTQIVLMLIEILNTPIVNGLSDPRGTNFEVTKKLTDRAESVTPKIPDVPINLLSRGKKNRGVVS